MQQHLLRNSSPKEHRNKAGNLQIAKGIGVLRDLTAIRDSSHCQLSVENFNYGQAAESRDGARLRFT